MQLELLLLNKDKITVDTEVSQDETIIQFMNRHGLYSDVPDNFKSLIHNGKRIDNNEPIINYINGNKLCFWYQPRWFTM
jgi:hypothetical protein